MYVILFFYIKFFIRGLYCDYMYMCVIYGKLYMDQLEVIYI